MKLKIRFFLSLCLLLLGGLNGLLTGATLSGVESESSRFLENSVAASFTMAPSHELLLCFNPAGEPNSKTRFFTTESEDEQEESDEFTVLKKCRHPNNYFSFFYSTSGAGYNETPIWRLLQNEHHLFVPSNRCVLFQVFRI